MDRTPPRQPPDGHADVTRAGRRRDARPTQTNLQNRGRVEATPEQEPRRDPAEEIRTGARRKLLEVTEEEKKDQQEREGFIPTGRQLRRSPRLETRAKSREEEIEGHGGAREQGHQSVRGTEKHGDADKEKRQSAGNKTSREHRGDRDHRSAEAKGSEEGEETETPRRSQRERVRPRRYEDFELLGQATRKPWKRK